MTAEFLRRNEITHLLSIEPEEAYCSRLRARFSGHDVHCGTIADLRSPISWNSIVSINVLEHIEKDEDELAAYYRLLQPAQGALCLFVPARPELYAPIDKDFGHFRRYTRPELRRKLTTAGFAISRMRYYNFAGYFAWWLSFCLLRKRSFDPSSVHIYDSLIFPAVHAIEFNLCAPPFGQNLLAVALAR